MNWKNPLHEDLNLISFFLSLHYVSIMNTFQKCIYFNKILSQIMGQKQTRSWYGGYLKTETELWGEEIENCCFSVFYSSTHYLLFFSEYLLLPYLCFEIFSRYLMTPPSLLFLSGYVRMFPVTGCQIYRLILLLT